MKAKYTLIKVAKKGERKSQSFWNNLLKVANSGPQGTIITADDLKRVDDHSNKLKRDVKIFNLTTFFFDKKSYIHSMLT